MEHLTVEEIIDFVSFDELTKENIDLALKVNKHIFSCAECMEKVNAFQNVYDELYRLGNGIDVKEMLKDSEAQILLKPERTLKDLKKELY